MHEKMNLHLEKGSIQDARMQWSSMEDIHSKHALCSCMHVRRQDFFGCSKQMGCKVTHVTRVGSRIAAVAPAKKA
jgi:hypothetical protein